MNLCAQALLVRRRCPQRAGPRTTIHYALSVTRRGEATAALTHREITFGNRSGAFSEEDGGA